MHTDERPVYTDLSVNKSAVEGKQIILATNGKQKRVAKGCMHALSDRRLSKEKGARSREVHATRMDGPPPHSPLPDGKRVLFRQIPMPERKMLKTVCCTECWGTAILTRQHHILRPRDQIHQIAARYRLHDGSAGNKSIHLSIHISIVLIPAIMYCATVARWAVYMSIHVEKPPPHRRHE